ncbi:hypothetical protein AOG23_34500 [Rhizobium acidisoli]|nr:hypothetical protein AOG23_34500 [Rhizobium acidisoli]
MVFGQSNIGEDETTALVLDPEIVMHLVDERLKRDEFVDRANPLQLFDLAHMAGAPAACRQSVMHDADPSPIGKSEGALLDLARFEFRRHQTTRSSDLATACGDEQKREFLRSAAEVLIRHRLPIKMAEGRIGILKPARGIKYGHCRLVQIERSSKKVRLINISKTIVLAV